MIAVRPGTPPFSVSQVSTLTASFAADVRAYAAAGADAIGVWEMKLEEDSLDPFPESGLGAASPVQISNCRAAI